MELSRLRSSLARAGSESVEVTKPPGSSRQPLNPWDIPPPPSHGDFDEEVLFAAIGRALTEWEKVETVCAELFAVFVSVSQTPLSGASVQGLPRWFAVLLSGMIPEGRIDGPDQVRQRPCRASLYCEAQDPLRDLPRRKGLLCRPKRVYGATIDRPTLEPRVRLATLQGYAAQVERRVQHLNDGFNMPHGFCQPQGFCFRVPARLGRNEA